MKKIHFLCYASFLASISTYAGVMRHDTDVQDYRDFAENLGKYKPGVSNIPVYKKDGTLDDYLRFAMPDLGMVSDKGYATVVSPTYIASVRHNTGYQTVKFGNNALYATTYKLIARNESPLSDIDFHLPRLNKVITDAAPIAAVEKSEIRKNNPERYHYYARVGAGTQAQVNAEQTQEVQIVGGYHWKTGGSINLNTVTFPSGTLRWVNSGPDSPNSTPLSTSALAGDSGSPVLVYDEVDQQWKIAGVLHALFPRKIYNTTSGAEYIPDNYITNQLAEDTSPDVIDTVTAGTIYWRDSAIEQGASSWAWQGLDIAYRDKAPAQATNEELNATKHLRFNGEGGTIVLDDSVNMGAGKLQFSNDYIVQAAANTQASWAGGGIEVDADKTVLWQVNGVAGDALHKIGAGTLHINASGSNPGSLNVGDGTVILSQQADNEGKQQAFSSITLVSGRPTVKLQDTNQVDSNNIYFGYRGGKLDLNGNALTFKQINHNDAGATLLNSNSAQQAAITITGHTSDEIAFQTWTGTRKGTVGDIYRYANPKTHDTEYFQLNNSSYGYFPTDKTSDTTWTYLGTDAKAAIEHRLQQLNQIVYRGYIGEAESNKTNGAIELNVAPEQDNAILAFTGGMNLQGDINVQKGTTLLSGQPVPHAANKIIDDDWYTSEFTANNINVTENSSLQVGEYAIVNANINTDINTQVLLGYNNSQQQIWRCYAPINTQNSNCSLASRTADQLDRLPLSLINGDVNLGTNSQLYLGKAKLNGAIFTEPTSKVTLSANAHWQMTGDSIVSTLNAQAGSHLNMLSEDKSNWQPKTLMVENLAATGMQLDLGFDPQQNRIDQLIINNSATGGDNVLNVSSLLDEPVTFVNPLQMVLIDAPVGTAHSYFHIPTVSKGFSLYSANYEVIDFGQRVLWVIKNQEQANDPLYKLLASAEPTVLTSSSWFNVQDNQALIHDTRAIMASRQYLYYQATTQMNKRPALIRSNPSLTGAWANLYYHSGNYEDRDIDQQGINVGWDTQTDRGLFGITAGYTGGKNKGLGQDKHQLANLGAYYSWLSPIGWFVDIAGNYIHMRQDLDLSPMLAIDKVKRNTSVLAASIKIGHQFSFDAGNFLISPSVEIIGGHLPGYELKGDDLAIKLDSSTPYLVSSGVSFTKYDIWPNQTNLLLNAGIFYQTSPGKTSSDLYLTDSTKSRHYSPWSLDRVLAEVGLEGELSPNWTIGLKAQTTFGGRFDTDFTGTLGVTYSF